MGATLIISFRRPDFNRNLENVRSFWADFLKDIPSLHSFQELQTTATPSFFPLAPFPVFTLPSLSSHTYRKIQKVSVAPLAASQMVVFFMRHVNPLKETIWRDI